MEKDCRKLKKERETGKHYKYNKVEYLTENYEFRQKIKNKSMQEESKD